jgi:alpha-beta hydrolase superfamily lysophospholipase
MAAMVRADERLKKELSQITLPVLIMRGTADQATKPSASQRFDDTLSAADSNARGQLLRDLALS